MATERPTSGPPPLRYVAVLAEGFAFDAAARAALTQAGARVVTAYPELGVVVLEAHEGFTPPPWVEALERDGAVEGW